MTKAQLLIVYSVAWPQPIPQEREGIWANFFGTNHSAVLCHMSSDITTEMAKTRLTS